MRSNRDTAEAAGRIGSHAEHQGTALVFRPALSLPCKVVMRPIEDKNVCELESSMENSERNQELLSLRVQFQDLLHKIPTSNLARSSRHHFSLVPLKRGRMEGCFSVDGGGLFGPKILALSLTRPEILGSDLTSLGFVPSSPEALPQGFL